MSKNITEKLASILLEVNPSIKYNDDYHLRRDLNLDSLDIISFLFEVEIAFDIKIPEEDIEPKNLLLLGALRNYIQKKLV